MYKLLDLNEESQLHLQRIADRYADVAQRLAEAEGEKETIRDDLWPLFDSLGGRETQLYYESLEPHLGKRLARELSQRRVFDVAGLRSVLSAAAFKSISTTSIDTKALDVLLRRRLIDAELVARYTSLQTVVRGPLWKPSGGEVHLQPGQLAVVLPDDAEDA